MSHVPNLFSQEFWPGHSLAGQFSDGATVLAPAQVQEYTTSDSSLLYNQPKPKYLSVHEEMLQQAKRLADYEMESRAPTLAEYGIKDAIKVEAVKADSTKTDLSLVPWDAVEEIAKVLNFGANKYAAHNWKLGGGFRWTRVASSLLRHTFAWLGGEDKDPESGLSHLAHMGCNIFFLLHYNNNKAQYPNDDRYK